MYTTESANLSVSVNRHKVNPKYRNQYHAMPPIGWMNDPNGLAYYNGLYHVFFQFNPYSPTGGAMHWGHFISQDMIHFSYVGVALAPDHENETSCYSGGAIVNPDKDNQLILYYTQHYEKDGIRHEHQIYAVSEDGMTFQKAKHPILDHTALPIGSDLHEFRDPNPVYVDGNFYLFVGSKNQQGEGQILVFRGKKYEQFEFAFTIPSAWYFGEMAECPDFFRLDGKDVLLFSSIGVVSQGDKTYGRNTSLYAIGNLDFSTGTFHVDHVDEIDLGPDFYAPQTLLSPKRERLMIAWMDMWGKHYPTQSLSHQWVGSLTLTRELRIRDGQLKQYPISSIRNNFVFLSDIDTHSIIPKQSLISIHSKKEPWSVRLQNPLIPTEHFTIAQENGKIKLIVQNLPLTASFFRESRISQTGDFRVDVFLDTSSIEIFIGDGDEVMTARLYMDSEYMVLLPESIEKIHGQIYAYKGERQNG